MRVLERTVSSDSSGFSGERWRNIRVTSGAVSTFNTILLITLGGVGQLFPLFYSYSRGWELEGLGSSPFSAIDFLEEPGQVTSLQGLFPHPKTGDNTTQLAAVGRAKGNGKCHRAGAQGGKGENGT